MLRCFGKRMFIVFLLLILNVSFVSASDHHTRVTFVNPGFEHQGFWKAVTEAMTAAAGQLGFDLTVRYSDRQWPAMIKNAEHAISSPDSIDFLILINEHQQAGELLEKADKAGIPTLMLLNTLTPEQIVTYGKPRDKLKHWLGSITPDNRIAGYEMAISLLSGEGVDKAEISLLTLSGDNVTPASIYRLQGLDTALKEKPYLIEKRRISVNWSGDEAYKRTKLWLDNNHPLSAVWAANDPIALGAIRAIKEHSMQAGKDVKVAGLNWSQEAIDSVVKGEMTLTHGGHFLAGAWLMVMLYDYINGIDFEDLGTALKFPMTSIHQGNAEVYKRKFSDGDWSKIDFRAFTRMHSNHPERYEFTLDNVLKLSRELN